MAAAGYAEFDEEDSFLGQVQQSPSHHLALGSHRQKRSSNNSLASCLRPSSTHHGSIGPGPAKKRSSQRTKKYGQQQRRSTDTRPRTAVYMVAEKMAQEREAIMGRRRKIRNGNTTERLGNERVSPGRCRGGDRRRAGASSKAGKKETLSSIHGA
jgi:hypothetical protein